MTTFGIPEAIPGSWENGGETLLFVYTPLCGTCKLAERMLGIVQETMPGLPLAKMNIAQIKSLVGPWNITSVPCLLHVRNGHVLQRLYAFRDVPYLYSVLAAWHRSL